MDVGRSSTKNTKVAKDIWMITTFSIQSYKKIHKKNLVVILTMTTYSKSYLNKQNVSDGWRKIIETVVSGLVITNSHMILLYIYDRGDGFPENMVQPRSHHMLCDKLWAIIQVSKQIAHIEVTWRMRHLTGASAIIIIFWGKDFLQAHMLS